MNLEWLRLIGILGILAIGLTLTITGAYSIHPGLGLISVGLSVIVIGVAILSG